MFLFSGLAISAVARAAGRVVYRGPRRSSATTPGSWTAPSSPTTRASSTSAPRTRCASSRRPGLLAVLAPIAVGFWLGFDPLGGYLAGAIAAGVLMAIFLANSGGAWDNAKKLVEDGNYGGKGSDAHAATVIGDTVGDPFKDTAGPALNPLIKVMNLVALLVAPTVVKYGVHGPHQNTASASSSAWSRSRSSSARSSSASGVGSIGDEAAGGTPVGRSPAAASPMRIPRRGRRAPPADDVAVPAQPDAAAAPSTGRTAATTTAPADRRPSRRRRRPPDGQPPANRTASRPAVEAGGRPVVLTAATDAAAGSNATTAPTSHHVASTRPPSVRLRRHPADRASRRRPRRRDTASTPSTRRCRPDLTALKAPVPDVRGRRARRPMDEVDASPRSTPSASARRRQDQRRPQRDSGRRHVVDERSCVQLVRTDSGGSSRQRVSYRVDRAGWPGDAVSLFGAAAASPPRRSRGRCSRARQFVRRGTAPGSRSSSRTAGGSTRWPRPSRARASAATTRWSPPTAGSRVRTAVQRRARPLADSLDPGRRQGPAGRLRARRRSGCARGRSPPAGATRSGYLLARPSRTTRPPGGGRAAGRLGVAAVSLAARGGPGWRVTSARRLRRLAELVGDRPPRGRRGRWPALNRPLAAARPPHGGVLRASCTVRHWTGPDVAGSTGWQQGRRRRAPSSSSSSRRPRPARSAAISARLRRRVLDRAHPRPAPQRRRRPGRRTRAAVGAARGRRRPRLRAAVRRHAGPQAAGRQAEDAASRTPTSSTSPPTRTARARPSRGTWSRCSTRRCRCAGWCSTRSPRRRSPRRSPTRARSTSTSSTRRRPAASSTGSTATRSARCCGRRSCRGCRPAGCSPSPPG